MAKINRPDRTIDTGGGAYIPNIQGEGTIEIKGSVVQGDVFNDKDKDSHKGKK